MRLPVLDFHLRITAGCKGAWGGVGWGIRLGRFRIDKGKPSNRANREVKGGKVNRGGEAGRTAIFFF